MRFLDPAHPYAEDLDLFGKGSLFELLCTARTPVGEELLADWLRAPAPPPVVRARQEAVAELRSRLDLREDLAVLGEEVRSAGPSEALAAWGAAKASLDSYATRLAAALLACLGVIGLTAWAVWGQRDLFLLTLLVDGIFLWSFRKRVERAAQAAESLARDLGLLSQILARVEREPFSSGRLVELRAILDTDGRPPSFRIRRLDILIKALESRRNIFVGALDPVVLWTLQFTFAVEAWRKNFGPAIGRWLAVVAEFEALSALANYSYEHPADPFAELVEAGPYFEAENLTHPLLPESRAVSNDIRIGGGLQLFVVSGSNMSGKSTLLRTIGTNAVLAQCGAPVRATRLRLSPLAVGASIRIMDSLQDGTSRFYAEITRLRQIVDLTRGPLPALFLLDELLQGTNSHDRRIGAEGVVRGLIQRGAIGLLTTHDLALTQIVDIVGPSAVNVHFEDRLENGKLLFDYRLRPGVTKSSNALELMRSVGLEV